MRAPSCAIVAAMAAHAFDLGDALPTISTERMRLRWLTDADVPALLEIFGDAEVMRYWSHGPFASLDEAREYLRTIRECFARHELFQWGIERTPGEGGIIGTCTLAQLDGQHRRAELGFALARAHWGNGYMREVLPALLRFAFERMDLHRITADADPRNLASLGLLTRLGFRAEGHLREHYLVNGEKQDATLFGLLRKEWKD
jgi:ribosomal-protein-alanine N-acetyltransferase